MRISIHNSLAENSFSCDDKECFSISDDIHVIYDREKEILVIPFYYNEEERRENIITAFEYFKDGNFQINKEK